MKYVVENIDLRVYGGNKMNKGLQVKEGKIELIAPHKDKTITFTYPAKGPSNYVNVHEQISKDNLLLPTAEETASLVHAAWQNLDNKYSKEIVDILRKRWLWMFTGNLYVPNEGVYIQDNPKIKNGKVSMKKSDLVKKLESNDKSVRFVPFGFKTKRQSCLALAKNPYVIALTGEQGAEKLAEVADKYKYKPYVWSFNRVNEELTKVSALGSFWDFDRRLLVDGYYHDYDSDGFAFGVNKTGKASRKK